MTGWRGASSPRLVLIGCLALPNQEDRSPAFPLRPPTPQPGFHPGGWGVGRVECERPMGAPREGRGVGSAAGLPTGESSANGRAPHIPGPGAPPLATRVPAGRAQCHALLPMLLVRRPLEWWGGFGEAGVGDRGQPLWRATALPTWGPAPLQVGLVRDRKSGAGRSLIPWNLRGMPFKEGAVRESRPALRVCGHILPLSTPSRIISYKTYKW